MDPADERIGEARDAFARGDWTAAHDAYAAAAEIAPLEPDDTYALAGSAWWIGAMDEALDGYERAHELYLTAEDPRGAARCAIKLAAILRLRGDATMASGWMNRARRLLDDLPECVEHGSLLHLEVEAGLATGRDPGEVIALATAVREIGRRCDAPELVTAGAVTEARMRIRRGEVVAGMRQLDEAMLTVVSGGIEPAWAGNAYCHVIAACSEVRALSRAARWTDALERWSERVSPDAIFRGICRVHRAQVLQARGAWEAAESEAQRVCTDLEGIELGSVAEARYAIGEIRRLLGDLDGAEAAYRTASELGRDPQPGLALLSLARGRAAAAASAIRAALASAPDRITRARLLPAQVDIAITRGDLETARAAVEELVAIADTFGTSGLDIAADLAAGTLLLATGEPGEALGPLRKACQRAQISGTPYETARARSLMAAAYDALGDQDAASRELDAARGALPGPAAVAQLERSPSFPIPTQPAGGLTDRETEVLAHVATGATNREVAEALYISERTVARHLSNIFAKIGVSTRTEAAAFAFDHGLTIRRDTGGSRATPPGRSAGGRRTRPGSASRPG